MKFSTPLWISGVLISGIAGLLGLSGSIRRHRLEDLQTLISQPGEWDTDPALWGRNARRQYESWLLSQRVTNGNLGHAPRGAAGQLADPDSRILFAGFALSKDADAKGESMESRHPAVCLDCHSPRIGGLRITRSIFFDASDLQNLRTFVCAQCHSTTIQDEAGGVVPWTHKTDIESLLAALGPVFEWRHGVSGAPMIKLRHPEYELWSQGIHAQRGVSCADCHMPYVREGTASFSSHALGSPLRQDIHRGCGMCHREGEQELRARVKLIQERTLALQQRAKKALITAHQATGACLRAGIPETSLKPIHLLLREAQARWDFIASEGSAGFHAPQEAARVLGLAIDQARQAELEARQLLEKRGKPRLHLKSDSF